MSTPSPLASFHATDLELRRGQRLIWEDASWTVQGATTLVGANGQGKSSTLRMLAGQLAPTSGTLSFRAADGEVSVEAWMTRCSVAAPWLNLPGHLTLDEAMSFHGVYRTPRPGPLALGRLGRSVRAARGPQPAGVAMELGTTTALDAGLGLGHRGRRGALGRACEQPGRRWNPVDESPNDGRSSAFNRGCGDQR